jgi:hypothetical protein
VTRRRRSVSKRSRSRTTPSGSSQQAARDAESASSATPDKIPGQSPDAQDPSQGERGLRRAGKTAGIWAAGVLAAALATFLAGVFAGVPHWVHALVLGSDAANGRAVSQLPLAAVVMTEAVPCRSGWVVPDHGQRAIPYAQGQQPAGAMLSSGGNVIITVQGVTGQTVVLQSMTVVVIHRAPPMAGIYLPVGCQGELTPRQYVLNLDSPTPRVVPQPGSIAFPYTITNSNPEQFVVTPDIKSGDVQWFLYLTWTSGANQGRLVLDDSGKPFQTAATAGAKQFCNGSTGWKSAC